MNVVRQAVNGLFLGAVLILSACGGDDEVDLQQQIVGTWEVSDATIELNRQAPDDFSNTTATCFQGQGTDVSGQDILSILTQGLQSAANAGEFYVFNADARFVFNADNSYNVRDGDDSGQGTWLLTGNQLTFDDDQDITFVITIDGDQLSMTYTYQFAEADLNSSGFSTCVEQLTAVGITQLARAQ